MFLGNETREKSGFVSYVSISLCFDFDPRRGTFDRVALTSDVCMWFLGFVRVIGHMRTKRTTERTNPIRTVGASARRRVGALQRAVTSSKGRAGSVSSLVFAGMYAPVRFVCTYIMYIRYTLYVIFTLYLACSVCLQIFSPWCMLIVSCDAPTASAFKPLRSLS